MLVLSFLMVSLYDMNEREVRSMALNDNIKKIKISNGILSLYIESNHFVDSTGNSKLGKILNHKFLADKKMNNR